MTTIKDEIDTSSSGVHAKRNKRKKELAKLRKAKGKANGEAESSNEAEGSATGDDESTSKKSEEQIIDDLKRHLAAVSLRLNEAEKKRRKDNPGR